MSFFKFWSGGKKKTKETQPAPATYAPKTQNQPKEDDELPNDLEGTDENGVPYTIPDIRNTGSKTRNRNVSISRSGRHKFKNRARANIQENGVYDYKAQEFVADSRTDATVSHAVPSSSCRDAQISSSRITCTQAIPTTSQTTAV